MQTRHGVLRIALWSACIAAAVSARPASGQDDPEPIAAQRRVSPEGQALLTGWTSALDLPQWTDALVLAAAASGQPHLMFGGGWFDARFTWTRATGLVVDARAPRMIAREHAAQAAAAFTTWTRDILAPVFESPTLRYADDYHIDVVTVDGRRAVALAPCTPGAEYERVLFYFPANGSKLCEQSVAVRRVDPDDAGERATADSEITTTYAYRSVGERSELTETRTLFPLGEQIVTYEYADGDGPGASSANAWRRPSHVTVISPGMRLPIEIDLVRYVFDAEPGVPGAGGAGHGLESLIDLLGSAGGKVDPWVRGQVTLRGGTPLAGAEVHILLPARPAPPPGTAAPHADLVLLNDVIYLDPRDWERPRPLSAWAAGLPRGRAAERDAQLVATGRTDAAGKFEILVPRRFGTGPFRVTAASDAGMAIAGRVPTGDDVAMVAGPPTTASGRVRDADDEPVAGATVVIAGGAAARSAVTDEQVRFRVERLVPGRYTLSAGAAGHVPLLRDTVRVADGRELGVRLPRGATLTVTATIEMPDGDVRGLANVAVVALEQDALVYVLGRTDESGACELPGLPPGTYLVNGRSDAGASFGEEMVEVAQGDAELDAELMFEPHVDTPVTVVDGAGNPVVGMVFYTASQDEEYDAQHSQRIPGATDAAGRFAFAFEFDGPRALIYGLHAGYGIVRVAPDAHDDGSPLAVRAEPALHVFGAVRDAEGKPLPGALVMIESEVGDDEDALLINLRSGPDGTFDFPYVPRGTLFVSAELGDDAWSDDYPVTPVAGQDEYRIDVEIDTER